MIFPIRCFSCGKHIGHLQEEYEKLKREFSGKEGTAENHALNKLGMTRYCCRRMFIAHVDIVN